MKKLLPLLFLFFLPSSFSATLQQLEIGHWLEIEGQYLNNGFFSVKKILLKQPQNQVSLSGQLQQDNSGHLSLLNHRVKLSAAIAAQELVVNALIGKRVRIQGNIIGANTIEALAFAPSDFTEDQIEGPVEQLIFSVKGIQLDILNYKILAGTALNILIDRNQAIDTIAKVNRYTQYESATLTQAQNSAEIVSSTMEHTGNYLQIAEIFQQLEPGHWLEVKGRHLGGRLFSAEKVTVIEADDEVTLIGVIQENESKFPTLLNHQLVWADNIEIENVNLEKLGGQRVKAKGEISSSKLMRVNSLRSRDDERERLEGPAEHIISDALGHHIELAGYSVLITDKTKFSLAEGRTLDALTKADVNVVYKNIKLPEISQLDDDSFGKGMQLTDSLLFTSRSEIESVWEDNFDFENEDAENRQDRALSMRGRLEWMPDSQWGGRLEALFNSQHREREGRQNTDESEFNLGETYLRYHQSKELKIILGRQDFDDEREWLYDENLDAVRINMDWKGYQFDASLSTLYSNNGSRKQDARNFFLYASKEKEDQHLAAYWLQRDFANEYDEKSHHYGIRAIGEWLSSTTLHLDLALNRGSRSGKDIKAWAADIGGTWFIFEEKKLYGIFGFAHATGDKPNTDDDETFRQTGLQDNSDKSGGLTSYRYYGELSDPELSNMTIFSLGIGSRLKPNLSIDFIVHRFQVQTVATSVTDAEWDSRLTGIAKDLGLEADIILGFRSSFPWEVEAVLGHFAPGEAFRHTDSARLLKLQVKYKY